MAGRSGKKSNTRLNGGNYGKDVENEGRGVRARAGQ